jgi:succinate dehydrogenase / fumarate reductase cytochrome b subunit
LRYGGGIGQWSWLIHRLTGVGILLFLVIHIVDTFFVVAYPELYDHTVAIYGGLVSGLGPGVNGYYWPIRWAFRLAELGLIASVLFHAINGVRIIMVDFWPSTAKAQKQMFQAVLVLFFLILIPVTVVVFLPLTRAPEHWKMPAPATATDISPGE